MVSFSKGDIFMEDIVYFELNNWFAGKDYPAEEPFLSWMSGFHNQFCNEDWIKEHKLIVVKSIVDLSSNVCITAPGKWVEDNCPT